MTPQGASWLERVRSIRSWGRGGVRAPHKPLLLLLALGRLQQVGASEVAFAEVEPALHALLSDYGRPGAAVHPEYPFYHLVTDGLWLLTPAMAVAPGGSPTRRQLLAAHAVGRLQPDFEADLRMDPQLFASIARTLLDRSFPPSLHPEICATVGLDLDALEGGQRGDRPARDPGFRRAVLLAYEYRCAVCGYQGQLAGQFTGLDAAHVRWRAFDGPDRVDNGLALCSLHHKLFDTGVLGISDSYTVLVSSHFIGHNEAALQLVTRRSGTALIRPQPGQPPVAPEYLAWHRGQVFRGPERLGS